MVERVLVVGGDAAGMSAASQVKKRRGDEVEVVALERGHHASFSACGIPYWVAGDVGSADDLVARSVGAHHDNGIDLRMRHEAVGIDLDRRDVTVRALDEASTYRLPFDQLVLATGAVPVRPPLEGVAADGVYGVQTLDDGEALIAALQRQDPRRAVVVGGGYIGVEMAEAMLRHGLDVTVVDQAPEPLTTLDPDMGRLVREAMQEMGIDLRLSTPVERFETSGGRVTGVVAGGETLAADLVVLGLGVRPNTALAEAAGLPLGESGGLRVDEAMRVPGFDGVWAGGDCVETFHLVSQRWVHVPLGTHANKHGLTIGTNLGGGSATFPGVVGTAMTKVCELEIARTGLGEREAAAAGFDAVAATVASRTRAGYFPGSRPMTVKMVAERGTGRLLGAQVVGREGSAKRIDVCAVAIWNRLDVAEVASLDLGYAPPFSPVWDPVQVAARKAVAALGD